MVQPLGKPVCCFPKKLGTHLLYDQAIPHLGVYLKLKKIHVHSKMWTWMLIAALFVIANIWKQYKYLSTGEWTNVYIHIMEY